MSGSDSTRQFNQSWLVEEQDVISLGFPKVAVRTPLGPESGWSSIAKLGAIHGKTYRAYFLIVPNVKRRKLGRH